MKPTRTVYAYYYPEMRQLISEITQQFPHEVYLQSITGGLDSLHESLIELYTTVHSTDLPGLATFNNRYVTSGGSEGIFHTLAHIAASRLATPLYTYEGEYEGFGAYATNLGRLVTKLPFDIDPTRLTRGIVYLSNPSARFGNWLPDEIINAWGDAGHEIILDATYVGLTKPRVMPVSHPGISTIITSFSKPYGIYYHRIGLTFSRRPVATLEANKWFKNVLSILIAKEALARFPPPYFFNKYHATQLSAAATLSKELSIPVTSSDVLLLVHTPTASIPITSPLHGVFGRGDMLRFCVTPYFLGAEDEEYSNIQIAA